jgi:hypothetical protein
MTAPSPVFVRVSTKCFTVSSLFGARLATVEPSLFVETTLPDVETGGRDYCFVMTLCHPRLLIAGRCAVDCT